MRCVFRVCDGSEAHVVADVTTGQGLSEGYNCSGQMMSVGGSLANHRDLFLVGTTPKVQSHIQSQAGISLKKGKERVNPLL